MGQMGLEAGMRSFGPTCMRRLQCDQFEHDRRNHADVWGLRKEDRMRHYGLHFCKYAGRIARDDKEKPLALTLTDTFLISLSAANTMHQDFSKDTFLQVRLRPDVDPLRVFADAAGRFADACEKMDHLENSGTMACDANRAIMAWVIAMASEEGLDLIDRANKRRTELAAKLFYIRD